MKTITVASTNIDIHDGTVGLSASGGADSGILLYILMANLDPSSVIHTFTATADARNCGWPSYLDSFVEKCTDLTGFTNVIKYTYHINGTHTPDGLMMPLHKYANDEVVGLDIMYTGVTRYPPDDVLNTFKNTGEWYKARDPKIERPLYHLNKKWYTPFSRINKKNIAEIYKELNVTDTLLPLTRSCASNTTVGPCGHCWWCEEKLWAFGKL